jgi:cation/acetate symporter
LDKALTACPHGDRILQFGELRLGADIIMLATPELGGMPYVISGLVAAGGLAAALSTADALLLTIGNALAHDLTGQAHTSNRATSMRQVILSKFALLVVALIAAFMAAQRSGDILMLVTAAFSIAGAAFVPALVLGIFWPRTSRRGAVSGMLAGVGVTVYYMLMNWPAVRTALHLSGNGLWWGIQPVSAGLFGVAAGFITTVVVSLLTTAGRAPGPASQIRL